MSTKIINISLDPELLALIDAQAKSQYATRSEYIKRAILTQLKSEGRESNLASSPEVIANARRNQLRNFLETTPYNSLDEYA